MATQAAPAEIKAHLLQGETIVWQGQPRQGLMFTARRRVFDPIHPALDRDRRVWGDRLFTKLSSQQSRPLCARPLRAVWAVSGLRPFYSRRLVASAHVLRADKSSCADRAFRAVAKVSGPESGSAARNRPDRKGQWARHDHVWGATLHVQLSKRRVRGLDSFARSDTAVPRRR